MKLSAPVYHLKRKAKLLSRKEEIPLHEALNRIAAQEGLAGWSLLSAKVSATATASKLFAQLRPGDCVLLEAMKSGNRSAFFTLEYSEKDVLDRLHALGVERTRFEGLFESDSSDGINADYIVERLGSAPRGTLVVIDYLQLLDQKRENPELMVQVRKLRSFARDNGLIMVFLSQIDRSYDPLTKPCPGLEDVRLPNPLDLKLFSKTCFLHDGEVQFRAAS
jgi:hypothetical protein